MKEDFDKEAERVNIDDLDLYDYVYYFKDKPFTGIAFELFESGSLRTETKFEFGMENGESKEWYQNGQLKNDDNLKLGAKHGICKSWFEDGKPESISTYELGILTKKEIFDEEGNQIENFELKETDSNYQILLQNREREPAREKMLREKLGSNC